MALVRVLLLVVLCVGCVPAVPLTPSATLTSTPLLLATSSPVPLASPTPEPLDTGWQPLRPGFDRRVIQIYNEQNQHAESLHIWRLDQAYFRLDVVFQETALPLDTWQERTNALLVVNGGFFREENQQYYPNGLTVMNGQAYGSSYVGFGGMLAIGGDGAELRALEETPHDPSESLQAALQSFPILVKPGGRLGFPAEAEDNLRARRTVIAQDRDGRILFLVAPRPYFTLHQLGLYLTQSDLDLDIALNLDGGPSTGILVADPREGIESQVLLPIVILVYPR